MVYFTGDLREPKHIESIYEARTWKPFNGLDKSSNNSCYYVVTIKAVGMVPEGQALKPFGPDIRSYGWDGELATPLARLFPE